MLSKMCLKSRVTPNGEIIVEVPPSRHDVFHPVDIYEDVAIAYGYNNIIKTLPNTCTIGFQVQILTGIYNDYMRSIFKVRTVKFEVKELLFDIHDYLLLLIKID